MQDGLRCGNLWVGSVKVAEATASAFVSGIDLIMSGAVIDATELAAESVGVSEISTAVFQAGSHALSSGSRWVTFGTAFGTTSYHVSCTHLGGTNGGVELIGAGSKAVGSFIALGSTTTSTAVFDWVALARK